MIVLDKVDRYIPALIGAQLVIVVVFFLCMQSPEAIMQTLNLQSLFERSFWFTGTEAAELSIGINWTTIVFIAGMMIMVESMARSGFFRWLCLLLAKSVRYKATPILIIFMIMSAFLSMFIDSITVLLFLSSITVELSRVLKFDPVPMIIAEIFTANLGGASTLSGDPPNIIIGTSLGLTFSDFIQNTGMIVLISMVCIILFFYFCFRKAMKASEAALGNEEVNLIPKEAITDTRDFIVGIGIFLLTVALIITHSSTGLSMATISIIAAFLTLVTSWSCALHLIKKIDWKTLLFFIGLFIVVGGLEQTHTLELLASLIGKLGDGNLIIVIAIILWLSAITSAFVDNIPFAATMVPVI